MNSIRRQLTWKLLAAFAVPVALGGAVIFAVMRDESIEQFDATLEARAQAVAALMRPGTDGGIDPESAAAVIHYALAHPAGHSTDMPEDDSLLMFQIRTADGRPLVRSIALGTADLPFHDDASMQARFWNLTLPSKAAGRAVEFRFHPGASQAASAHDPVMVFADDRTDLDQTVASLALLLAGAGALVFLATVLIVPRVVRREFRPIDALADQAARIDANSLSARFSTQSLPVELSPIASRLNDLLTRLEHAFERERRFSGDVAHELRTPLAELRSLAELAMKWPEARPADTDQDVLDIANHMEGIVTRLLTILRTEHGRLVLQRQDVDVVRLARQEWATHDARALSRALRVRWALPDQLTVSADPVLLKSIVANVFRNAVDYAPADSEVRIDVRASESDGLIVGVVNDAPALSSDDVSRMFDRFWRGDAARSGADHAGLGLSLGRALARAMGGELKATLDSAGRLEVALVLPVLYPSFATV